MGSASLSMRLPTGTRDTHGTLSSTDTRFSFGRGEGAVAIVLKPLEDAIRDHDHIYATVRIFVRLLFRNLTDVAQILGTGVNSSGSLAPVSAPVASAQRDAMRRAFSQTDRKPQDVDFLELHATGTSCVCHLYAAVLTACVSGTASGDPTEANWVGAEFKRDDELVLGSVKGNVG